jgi:tagatose 6-phosphate kinase
MLLCVNLNAAVDKTLVIENFHLGTIHRPSFELSLPGGKGCNVARAATALGQQVVVSGWVGGHAGQFIEDGLRAEGIQAAFIHTAVESRSCVSILDPASGALTEIYEKGRPVSAQELEQFTHSFRQWLPRVRLVTLSGSLPPGVPVDFYASLIHMTRSAGVRVVLDSSGEALRTGVEVGRPDVLKCNRAELSALLGQPLTGTDALRSAILVLAARRPATVIITLGEQGAVAAEASGRLRWARAPQIEAVSTVGSGDAFLGGLACGLLAEKDLDESLSLAVAAGSANALQIGAGCLLAEDVDRLLKQMASAN